MKRVSRYLLIIGVTVCWTLLTIDAVLGADTKYKDYEYDITSEPVMSVTLRNIFSGEKPYLLALAQGDEIVKETEDSLAVAEPPVGEDETVSDEIVSEVTANDEDVAADGSEQTLEETDEGDPATEGNEEAAADLNESESTEGTGESEPATDEELPVEQEENATPAQTDEEKAPIEKAEEEVYVCTEVADDYFSDALFIGDSRTVGLSEYCQPLMERAVFYAKVSLTIYDFGKLEFVTVPVMTEETDGEGNPAEEGEIVAEVEGAPAEQAAEEAVNASPEEQAPETPVEEQESAEATEDVTIEEALSRQQFGKIYVMLGLNELGSGDTEYFFNKYATIIARIRELQPDAQIYIQGIMHVTEKLSNSDKVFKNEVINERNAAISQLADGKHIFYVDMNEATDDENGALAQDLSFDNVHLKAKSYALWYDYLKTHAYLKVNSVGTTE